MGIQTFILIVAMTSTSTVAIAGYGTKAECEVARKELQVVFFGAKAVCIPGPVETR